MRKKTFVPSARVIRTGRWRIDFTVVDTVTGQERRIRKEFGLNEIADMALRDAVATRICDFLTSFDFGMAASVPQQEPPLSEFITYALAEKCRTDRLSTAKTYTSTVRVFEKWATEKKLWDAPASKFGRREANAFIDWLRSQRNYAPRTLNNYRNEMYSLFAEVAESIPENPFKKVRKVAVDGKSRRPFTAEEKQIVASYIREHDYWLYRGLLLQYYCFVRPIEISRLRFRSFDLGAGIVKIESWEHKKRRVHYATIPESIMPYFRDGIFDKQPSNWYLFGRVGSPDQRYSEAMGPAPTPSRPDRAYKKHRKILHHLHAAGLLHNIDGLAWYSWKDTGISTHVRLTSPISTRDQAGHLDFDTTMIYYEAPIRNDEYARLVDDLS